MSVASLKLDYQKKVLTHPVYSLSKITPIQGSAPFAVTAGGNELIFECPPNQSWNPSKSFLNLTITPATSGVGNGNWLYGDTVACIQSIQVQTKGGLQLMNLTNYDVYHKAVLKAITKVDDYLENDHASFNNTGAFCGLHRSNALHDATAAVAPTVDLVNGLRYGPDATGANNNRANSNPNLGYTEFRYLVGGALNTATPVLNIRLPFSLLKEHFLGLDKDVLFPETIQIKIVFNPVSKIGFLSTNATQPYTGSAAIAAANYTVTNPFVYLAMEQDKEINNLVMQKVNSSEGLRVLIPYVYSIKTAFANAGIHAWSQRYNRSNGSHLLRVHMTATNLVETVNNTYNINNINGAKLNNFYFALNNNRIQQFNVSATTANLEDYISMLDYIRGSTLQTSDIFQYNWIFTQRFDQSSNALEYEPSEQNHIQALPLDVEQKIDFFGDGGIALNHYTYAVCLKELVISPSGIQLI